MNVLEVKFLGIPSIKLNGYEMNLPFAKAEYIIFLLVYEKNITRDKLCSLFWGDVKDEVAKKSLRNAVYTIRKNFYNDIITSPKRSLLQMDEGCMITTDIDIINDFIVCDELSENEINCYISIYSGEFLEGIENKSCAEFESWLNIRRSKNKKIYVDKLKEIIIILMNKENYVLGEKCCNKLIELEEFDEIGYKNLMIIYSNQERFSDAIKIYSTLEQTLKENLSINPLAETRKMFDSILNKQVSGKVESKRNDYFGREKEIELLKNNFIAFLSNKDFSSYIVFGEAGIGKTRLIEKVTENLNKDLIVIKFSCYEAESDFMFKLWDKIFENLSYIIKGKNINIPSDIINIINKSFPTLNIGLGNNEYHSNEVRASNNTYIENYISDMFTIISKIQKVVFVIDDLNWSDKNSLELLCKVVFSNRFNMMILASCRDESRDSIEKFYFNLCPNKNINKIELKRFSYSETNELIYMIMPEYTKHNVIIYNESEGNPLFITEMINSLKQGMNASDMTDMMATLISGRIVKLSIEARKLLAICSMFYEVFDVKMLSKITNVSSFNIIESIEELIVKNILKEIKYSDANCGLIFTHQKIREYIYNTVSNSKRIVLHEAIGEYYETKIRNSKIDRIYFANLIYHFTMSNNKYKIFKYEIKNMQVIFDVSHEIFPILDDERYIGIFEYYSDEKLLADKFDKINIINDELNFEENQEKYELQIIYLYLYGRFHKDIGDPLKGVVAIEKMINLSLKKEYYEYVFEGYLQLIQYGINTNNLEIMIYYIENAEKISQINNDLGKISLVLRHKGYYNILKGDFENGENNIFQALDIFNSLIDKNKYILNIAASYFYIGESKKLQKKYNEAIEYYNKAFELCDEDEDFPAIAVILSKIGYIKFELENYDEALFYMLKSLKAYNKTVFAWGRAEVYYYLALIYDKKNIKEKSKYYIEGALLFCDKCYNNNLNKKAKLFLEGIEY